MVYVGVLANHFALELPNGNVYHYDVAIFPPLREEKAKAPGQKKMRTLSTHVNRRVIQQLVDKYCGELNKCLPAFDGRKNLYTRRKLPFEKRICTVDYEEEEARRPGEPLRQFLVKIHYAATVNLDALHAVYNNRVRVVPHHINTLDEELKLLKVEAMHLPYPRKYRVIKITRVSVVKLEFSLEDNTKISVAEYFRRRYPKFAHYPQLPCIMVGSATRPVLIPLEACKIPKGQPYRRKLAPDMTKEMIKRTAQPPALWFAKIKEAVQDVVQKSQPYLSEFGTKISTEPTQLKGRVLEAPTIVMKGDQKLYPREGSWDLRDEQFHQAASVESWVLLGMNTPRLRRDELKNFIRLFQETGGKLGMSVSNPLDTRMKDVGRISTSQILADIKKDCPSVQLVIVVLGRGSSYADIKQTAETSLGIRTQCILEQNFTRNCKPQLMVNLCQKINVKMGGVNNSLLQAQKPEIFMKPVIIIGADVTHPAPGDRIQPSIAACVGSLDSIPSKYRASIRVQLENHEAVARVEMIKDLNKGMVMELLKAFREATRHKPEHIIFYRDGVSEGQFAEVRDLELQAIRDACLSLQPDGSFKPPVTFIVVQKRHHIRFMPTNNRDGVGKTHNVPPGTTVDTVVTHPVDFDFFLCSHYGIQGTSKPAYYYVVHDDYNFSSDDLQKLSYYLCHTYARCARSVSIPAPVYYAHLAAFTAKEHIFSKVCSGGQPEFLDQGV
ncbi:protein argonaute-2 [Ixodes scapularis]